MSPFFVTVALALATAVLISVALIFAVLGVNAIIRKVNPKWGIKIDEFWRYF